MSLLRKFSVVLLLALALTAGSALAQDEEPLTEEALNIDLTPPEYGTFDEADVMEIDVSAYPILPDVTDHVRIIYQRGIENGNNPYRFSKLGDCMTATYEHFLGPFGTGEYDLGEYEELQEVIDHFSVPARDEGFEFDSFSNPGLATANGFNTASVLDSIWANPDWCQAGESPLACEYRVTNPIYSLIMFGTNDVMFIPAADFDFYLRTVVLETIKRNIVPVLYTIPTRPEFPDRTALYNQIIINIAEDYDLPLVNLWLAIRDLPNEGVDPIEPIHLSFAEEGNSGYLTEEYLQYGYPMRNLLTLQTLKILNDALYEGEDEAA